jgi:hypothetical protein
VHGVIPGLPVELTGTAVLAPAKAGGGSRQDFRATVEVRIPLLGGTLEDVIGGHLTDLFINEQRFTAAWIADNT